MHRNAVQLGVVCLLLGAGSAFAFPPIDLTTSGATYLSPDGTYWEQDVIQPAGTGVYDPFLRLQANHVEEGMNTDAMPEIYDNVGGGDQHTHSFTLGELIATSANVGTGTQDYYVFRLDINEPNGGGKHLLSLDEIRIYTVANSAGGSLTSEGDVVAHGGAERYDLDQIIDQDVYLNHKLEEGSGKDDMQVWIPTSYFAGASATDYVYFYSKFGDTGRAYGADFKSGDGFEEWKGLMGESAPPTPTPPPDELPEPASAALLGVGLLGIALANRKPAPKR